MTVVRPTTEQLDHAVGAVDRAGGFMMSVPCRGRTIAYGSKTAHTCRCGQKVRASLTYKAPDLIGKTDIHQENPPYYHRTVRVCLDCDAGFRFPVLQ